MKTVFLPGQPESFVIGPSIRKMKSLNSQTFMPPFSKHKAWEPKSLRTDKATWGLKLQSNPQAQMQVFLQGQEDGGDFVFWEKF